MESIDQLLFGYRDGHELIAGSCELSAAQLRDVLPHVDASIAEGEPPELVGVWVGSLDRYLLARVWSAPELPRPGAVWAHALLIGPRALRSSPVTGLLALLRRPAADRVETYCAPLPWPAGAALTAAAVPLTRALVWAALAPDARAGVVLCQEPQASEEPLLALLDAIPGMARRALSFRTGARTRAGAYQVAIAGTPSGPVADAGCKVIDAGSAPPAPPPEWTNLLDPGESGARQRAFLSRFGEAEDCTPRLLPALLGLLELIDGRAPAQVVVSTLVEHFPAPGQFWALRAALLGDARRDQAVSAVAEEERLALLLDHQRHFDLLGLGLSERLAALTQSDPSAVLRLVERTRTSRRAA